MMIVRGLKQAVLATRKTAQGAAKAAQDWLKIKMLGFHIRLTGRDARDDARERGNCTEKIWKSNGKIGGLFSGPDGKWGHDFAALASGGGRSWRVLLTVLRSLASRLANSRSSRSVVSIHSVAAVVPTWVDWYRHSSMPMPRNRMDRRSAVNSVRAASNWIWACKIFIFGPDISSSVAAAREAGMRDPFLCS